MAATRKEKIMQLNEKYPPESGHFQMGEARRKTTAEDDFAISNFTPPPQKKQQKMIVSRLLRHGARNFTSTNDLLQMTGYRNARELQQQISEERNAGLLILSSTSGYFLPSTNPETAVEEITAFTKTMRSRAISTLSAMRPARIALRQLKLKLSHHDSIPSHNEQE